MVERGLRPFVLLVLAVAAIGVFYRVYTFGQQRFFTIDEYQYGHATWLVSKGEKPYVDFYEHHFPLSYVAHAPLLACRGSFSHRALRLRSISTGYLLALALVLATATRLVTRSTVAALLCGFLPVAFGFSLMSAVDYRADNFAACLWLACLSLLEVGRTRRRKGMAVLCGVLAALAILMTQKMLALAGATVGLYLLVDHLPGRPPDRDVRREAGRPPLLAHPGTFLLAAAAVLALAVGVAAALGVLPSAFEITILQAIRHEAIYPDDPVGRFVRPFFAATGWTTTPILAFAAVFFALSRSVFWAIPLGVALLAGGLIAGQYPYNYVFLCLVLVSCAARGFVLAAQRLEAALPRRRALHALLPLLPLAVLPDQLAFVANRTSNAHQLALLDKIERYTGEDDVVIDSAGGALFRPHASYYWYHGFAHRKMFADYFSRRLVEDYRRSRALLWIEDGRLYQLPDTVLDYFRAHYVRGDGSLHALGFLTPETSRGEATRLSLDVVRSGEYSLLPVGPPLAGGRAGGLEIDGRPVRGTHLWLGEGRHPVTVRPNTPRIIVSLLPRSFFRDQVTEGRDHTLLFEYE